MILGFVFIPFLAIGGIFGIISVVKVTTLESTQSEIVGLETDGCSKGGSKKVVEYFDEFNQEETFQFVGGICTSPAPSIGKEITVLYNPDVPGKGSDGSFIGKTPLSYDESSLCCLVFNKLTRKAFFGLLLLTTPCKKVYGSIQLFLEVWE